MKNQPVMSVVVPVFNEADGIVSFHELLTETLHTIVGQAYEIVYCNDGSTDETVTVVRDIAKNDNHVRLISLSRNFGKESALVAGIEAARGQAVILIDGDGQHPIAALPDFYAQWKGGAQVVIGQRSCKDAETFAKKMTSKLFYSLHGMATGARVDPLTTDYRLLDREVVTAYLRLSEANRLNRFLIDWLGFERAYVPIDRGERIAGESKFTVKALTQLALDAMISSSMRPLYVLLAIGCVIMAGSLALGAVVGIEQIVLGDPLEWNFTGTALLSILILFLVGLVLISQGIASLYIAASYRQVKQRPLYVINQKLSYDYNKEEKK